MALPGGHGGLGLDLPADVAQRTDVPVLHRPLTGDLALRDGYQDQPAIRTRGARRGPAGQVRVRW